MKEELRKYRALAVTLIATLVVAILLFVHFLSVDIENAERAFESSVARAAARGEAHMSLLIERLGALGRAYLLLGADDRQLLDVTRTERLDTVLESLCVRERDEHRMLYTATSVDAGETKAGRCAPVGASTPALVLTVGPGALSSEVRLVPSSTDVDARALAFRIRAGERELLVTVTTAGLLESMAGTLATSDRSVARVCFSLLVGEAVERLDCRWRDERARSLAAEMPSGGDRDRIERGETAGLDWQVSATPDHRMIAGKVTSTPFLVLGIALAVGGLTCAFAYSAVGKNLRLEAQAEEQQRLLKLLEGRNRELNQFASMAAHDLQAPLRFIVANTHLLDMELDALARPDLSRFTEIVITQGERMHGLMLDLLEFCRAGQNDPSLSSVDVSTLVEEEVRLLRAGEEHTRTRICIGTLPRTLVADAGTLRQVFRNLLDNAVKYSRGNAAPAVSVEAHRAARGDSWTFRIEDNGPGIAVEHRERVFEPFRRLDSATEGTGMGLAIVRKLLERHGGTIWLDPHRAEGCAFCFTLPEPPNPEDS